MRQRTCWFINVGVSTPDEPGKIDCEELVHRYQVDVASADCLMILIFKLSASCIHSE